MKIKINKRPRLFSFFVVMSVLTIFNSCNDTEDKMKPSRANADFLADKTDVLTDQLVTFNDLSEGDVTHWSWIFDGATPNKSHEQNPKIYYNKPGNYTVKLIVSNSEYTDELVKEEYISVTLTPQPITAKFSADKMKVLSGGTITFTDESEGGPTVWKWEFIPESGQAITSSEKNPAISFESEGTYTVKLTTSNSSYSDVATKEDYITVMDANAIAVDFSTENTLTYTGKEILFTDLSEGMVTEWEWLFEGATPTKSKEQNPKVIYNTAGLYKVKLTTSNGSGSSTVEKNGYVTVVPSDELVTLISFDGDPDDLGPLNLDVDNINNAIKFNGTDRKGSKNKTAVFDGSGYLKIQPHPDKQLIESFSVGIWMKTDNPERAWIWTEGRQDDVASWFRINQNSSTQIYSFLPQLGGIFHVNVDDEAVLHDDIWHYVMCVRDAGAGTAQIYVDGKLVAKRALTVVDLSNNHGFFIGAQNVGPGNVSFFFNGELDDLVIYKKALTESEIILLSEF